MMGAVTPGFDSIHARATCAFEFPRCLRDRAQPLDDAEIRILVIHFLCIFIGIGANRRSEIGFGPRCRQEIRAPAGSTE